MKKTIIVWILSIIITELPRFIIGIEKYANEIQVLSAVPWIPLMYHMWQIHERHKRIEQHLKEGAKHVQ